MRKRITENEFIRKNCRIDFTWDSDRERWIVKIKHLAEVKRFTSVRVTMGGFENFQYACDEAMKLFKRNMRNKIFDRGTIRADFSSTDIWPDFIMEGSL